MKAKEPRDRSASVRARLLNLARDRPSPLIRVYSPETVIAEKLEAIVSLGICNSRIKDFFDIDYLARSQRFDRAVLVEAVCRTFTRRGTPIPPQPPIGLTPEFWSQPGREAQIRVMSLQAPFSSGLRWSRN